MQKISACLFILLLQTLIFEALSLGQFKPAADLIVNNAKGWKWDPARPSAEAVAVLGDRIVGGRV